jgi:hypothetical protein
VDSVLSYLSDIAKQYGECYAMRFVRMIMKFRLRDEEEMIDLPSNITKQSWIARADNCGVYSCEEQNTEKTFWEDCETQEICSWWKFRELWAKHLPRVRIRNPCNLNVVNAQFSKNACWYREEHNQAKKSV